VTIARIYDENLVASVDVLLRRRSCILADRLQHFAQLARALEIARLHVRSEHPLHAIDRLRGLLARLRRKLLRDLLACFENVHVLAYVLTGDLLLHRLVHGVAVASPRRLDTVRERLAEMRRVISEQREPEI
jgi:hypothetical protein